jgi:dihydrofolate reductase
MKIILVFVSTLDGKVTKWSNPMVRSWSSKSDQEHFSRIWNDSNLIVMGSNSFDADPLKPSARQRLVVMTHSPSEYEEYEVPGQLEFTGDSPSLLCSRLEREGHDQMLLVGGPHVAASFLKEKLVDELWLTIEPRIFGLGGNLVAEEKLDIELRLISCEKANEMGTLFTRYTVIKSNDN